MSRSNIVLWVKKSLEEGRNLRIVADQYRTPTLAEDLAEGCIRIALQRATGLYNISGGEYMSVLEMSQRIARYCGLDASLLQPVTTAELGQAAPRPLKSGFVIDKAIKDLGYHPRTLEQGIALILEQWDQIKIKQHEQ
jgi:dTDP-4-dehydrorhamnose reductase